MGHNKTYHFTYWSMIHIYVAKKKMAPRDILAAVAPLQDSVQKGPDGASYR